MKPYYFYVLYTADHFFYAGYTDDVGKRFATHQAGLGAKYTRVKSRHPLRLIYAEAFPDKSQALKAEAAFKKLSRAQKEDFLRERGIEW
jgi:putative endonuclease